ncbi:type I 3-dehydroquinate dehydratase [Persephonella sp.]
MELGYRPLIALPLNDKNLDQNLIKAKEKNIDIIEIRVDMFSNLEIDYIVEKVKQAKEKGFYTIVTVRSKKEGGVKDIPDNERLKIFEVVSDYSDILDIELTSDNIQKDVIKIAREKNILSLVSYHDFEKTPSEREIQEIIDSSVKLGADIIKYAFMVKNVEDVGRILSVTHKNRDKKLVAIGMGEVGKITRVAGFFFGSLITYTYIGKSVAPGQIEVEELIKELEFYGLRR